MVRTTAKNITDIQIASLCAEAIAAGDYVMRDICYRALHGSTTDRRKCAIAIAEAESQDDGE